MSLSKPTKLLHSIIAFSMIGLISVGIYMHETETLALYPLHKSVGVIVFLIALYRVINRIKEGWPEPLGSAPAIQQLAAKFVHWALIISTLLYPISGMMMSGAGGHGISVFGLELIASNYSPNGEAIPLNGNIAGLGHNVHGSLTWVLIAIIVLHVIGALKHHYIDKDETLKRMFSFNK